MTYCHDDLTYTKRKRKKFWGKLWKRGPVGLNKTVLYLVDNERDRGQHYTPIFTTIFI